nr:hypothetical protein [Tanacetum cinerariifolium]
MCTRSSSNLHVVSSNPSTSNPKCRSRRRSKQPFILEESPMDTMADQRPMAELLRAPTEGYAEEIVVPSILADQFELKHSLINMMTTDQIISKDTFQQPQLITIRVILFIVLQVDERVEETLTDPDLSEYTIKVPPPPVQKYKPPSQREYVVHQRDPLHLNIPYPSRMLKQKQQEKNEVQIQNFWQMFKQLYINITLADALILMPKYQKMLKALISNKEKLQELANTPLNENCSAVILKKLPEKLKDPGKFLIPCGFSELKCKALADLGASINLIPLSIWKKLANFVIVDYESDPRVPLILGRPFLRTAHALIDVHGEEMILRDGDERLILNMRHDTSSYSNQPQRESINLINIFNNSSEDFLKDLFSNQPSGNPTFSSHPELTSPKVNDDIFDSEGGNVLSEKLLDLDSTKDLHPPLHVNLLSSSTTYSSNPLLEEFADELALITFPPKYDNDLQLINLTNPADNFVDSMPEMFTDEHALDYSSPLIFDEYDDDFLEVESDTKNVYDDPFDSKGEKFKESKLLIDELDLPYDFPSSDLEKPFEIITRVVQDKKLATSNASLMLEDFDPPFYEPLFLKEVPSIPRNVKTNTGFCPPIFISTASLGNHVS